MSGASSEIQGFVFFVSFVLVGLATRNLQREAKTRRIRRDD